MNIEKEIQQVAAIEASKKKFLEGLQHKLHKLGDALPANMDFTATAKSINDFGVITRSMIADYEKYLEGEQINEDQKSKAITDYYISANRIQSKIISDYFKS